MTEFPSLARHFSRALASPRYRLHLAAHSHHLWPDVTRAAQAAAWDDAATWWDGKWERVFAEVIPAAQAHIARHLNLAAPDGISFAPNTHDFVRRLLSALPAGRAPRILTTDSEFHSLDRQLSRLEEEGLVEVVRVATRPFASFMARFGAAARMPTDMVFFSQVFFNSGWVVPDVAALVACVPDPATLVVIDGYHGFMARPTDLAAVQGRAFYLAGGYKYAMAGEGACFMHCPPGYGPRPRDTGWYAGFGALAAPRDGAVGYGDDYTRFLGATFDPSGLYRLNAVMDWIAGLGLTVADIHARAVRMQEGFLEKIAVPGLMRGELLAPEVGERGNFLAFESARASALHARLTAAGIVTDLRGDVLRVGFGLYHAPGDLPGIAGSMRAAVE